MTIVLTVLTSAAAVFLLALFRHAFDRGSATTAVAPIDGHGAARVAPEAVRFSFDAKSFAAGALAGIFALGMVGLLAQDDSPEMSSGAISTRSSGQPGPSAVEQLAAAALAPDAESQTQSPSQASLGTVDEMIRRLVERLNRNPKDAQGWGMLGWSYFNIERFAQSAEAYGKAIALNPASAELRSARGEAMVSAADGLVTDEAKVEFGQALRLDAKDPRGRFFAGLAEEQAGNKRAALDGWVALLNDTDSDDAWVADLRQRVTELSQETGADVSARLDRPKPAASDGLLRALRQQEAIPAATAPNRGGPSSDEVRNAESMRPSDRMAMAQGMVDRLASRLEQSPRDLEGWIKLMRSRQVLGETEGAQETFRFALDVFKDSPSEQERISAAARELGLLK